MIARVVHAVLPRDDTELRRAVDETPGSVPMVELRADAWIGAPEPLFAALDAWRARGHETLFTMRHAREGGAYQGSEQDRFVTLQAAASHTDWIDLEAWAIREGMTFAPARLIASHHDFDGQPGDLVATLARLDSVGADATKLAVTPTSDEDLLALAEAGAQRAPRTRVLLGMGERGLISRVAPHWFGSAWTYGAGPAGGTAPGQVLSHRLVDDYAIGQETRGREWSFVVGRPIAHSLSPALHNAACAAVGVRRTLVPLCVDEFATALALADRWDVDAMAVTMPFKSDAKAASSPRPNALPFERDVDANTLRRAPDGGWHSANTDGRGVIQAFVEAGAPTDLTGHTALILGLGGAGRAAAVALRDAGAAVTVATRRPLPDGPDRVTHAAWNEVETAPFDLVVQSTPVGLGTDESPLPDAQFRAGQWVLDMIYHPAQTRFLAQAEAQGATPVSGTSMFLHQAAAQLEWFTGRDAPMDVMRHTMETRLGGDAPGSA